MPDNVLPIDEVFETVTEEAHWEFDMIEPSLEQLFDALIVKVSKSVEDGPLKKKVISKLAALACAVLE